MQRYTAQEIATYEQNQTHTHNIAPAHTTLSKLLINITHYFRDLCPLTTNQQNQFISKRSCFQNQNLNHPLVKSASTIPHSPAPPHCITQLRIHKITGLLMKYNKSFECATKKGYIKHQNTM